MKKKILIFGAYGNLGITFYSLMKSKYRIFRVGRSKNSQFQINQLNDCSKIIKIVKPDFILNLISETDVDKCEKNKDLSKKLNYNIPKKILFGIKKINKKIKFIHISTDQVYSKKKYPYKNKENDAKPINIYAKTKLMGEKLVKRKFIVLRTNFIGKSRKKNKKFFCDWVFKSIKNKKKLVGFDNIYFNPLNISTLCSLIEKVFIKNLKPGVYNLGSRGVINKYKLMKMFVEKFSSKKILPLKTNYKQKKNKAKRPLNMLMNSSKFERYTKIKLPNISHEIRKSILEF